VRVKLPGTNRWSPVLVGTLTTPQHMTRPDGTPVDVDGMLRRLRLMGSDFDGAPSHRDGSRAKSYKKKTG
jgi:hypothetical protein